MIAYYVLTTPLTMCVIQMRQFPTFSPKIGSSDPSIFCTGYLGDDPPKPWKCCENMTSFWETKTIFFRAPLYLGVRMLRFYFWVLNCPQLHKTFRAPQTSHFGDMGSKVQLSHRFPKNWVGRSPPYFAWGILGMTPQNTENFVKVLPPVSEIFGIFIFRRCLLHVVVAEAVTFWKHRELGSWTNCIVIL